MTDVFRGFYDLQPAFFWSPWNLLYPPVYLCVFRACATHFSLSFSRPWGCHKKVSAQFLARIPKIHTLTLSLLFSFVWFLFRVAFASFTSSMASNSTWLIRVNKKRLKLLFAIKNSRKLAQISYATLCCAVLCCAVVMHI